MTAQQVAADLRAAAEVLRRDGWTQGAMHCGTSHCALGALALVAAGSAVDPDDDDGEWRARYMDAVVAFEAGNNDRPTPWWNDTPGRTADEVIAALEAAADAAEAQQ